MKEPIVSIDGTAGSGKERIAKYIANKYKFFHLDSGILYRKIAYLALKKKINIKSEINIDNFISNIDFLSTRKSHILRSEKISKLSSNIAKIPKIRKFINSQQKKIVKNQLLLFRGCVIDGRDIGSYVFKNARIKLFIEVLPEIRAKRRHKQLIEIGEKSIYPQILKEIKLRDKTDIKRKSSPLVVPKGAIVINNSESFKETIKQINKAMEKF